MVPFAPFVGENFLLQDDNARPHVARVTRDFLETVGIKTFSVDVWRGLWRCTHAKLAPEQKVITVITVISVAGCSVAGQAEQKSFHI